MKQPSDKTQPSLRSRIRNGELLIGSFIKTPAPHIVEILGFAGLDFAVVDQEHAPISIAQMDILALVGRAAGLPLLSRRWGNSTDWIAPLLDLGLEGVMVPHVMDAAQAAAVCDAVRFSRGKRGLSPSPRAGNYGSYGIAEYRTHCDAQNVVMAQIEDQAALARLDEIAQEPDVDVLFVGPADLSQSMGVGFPSTELDTAIEKVIDAGKKAGVAVGLFVGNAADVPRWHKLGVTVFVCGSDQALLRKSAAQMLATARE